MIRVAVLASGGGSNLQSLLDGLGSDAPAKVECVLSDRTAAGALDRARQAGVATHVLRDPSDVREMEDALRDINLVVLAGYLRLVPREMIARFPARMINIHPALLPAFGGHGMYGRRVHEAVLASGATLSGATVHYVDEHYDHGAIIAQWPVPVLPRDDADTLAARVLAVEHQLLPAVVVRLARLRLPKDPVRFTATGPAFAARAGAAVELDDGTE